MKEEQSIPPKKLENIYVEGEDPRDLPELEAEYERELQALRRLIVYKKYPDRSTVNKCEIERRVRKEEQHKF